MTVVYLFLDAEFEWDERKAEANIRKHGVNFEEAVEVFADPDHLVGDAARDTEEDREYVLGLTFSTKLLLVVHTERRHRIRMISARLATKAESNTYEQSKR